MRIKLPGFEFPPLSRESREMRRVFSAIHAGKSWGESESLSGPGSTRERAATFLPDLIALIKSLCIETLLDVPCGDFNWTQPLADSVKNYIGVDVVPALIQTNRERWSSLNRRFLCRDMVRQRLPVADLVFCRDALVHLTHADIFRTIANFRRTRAEYLLVTTFIEDRTNNDIATGEWRPLNLQLPPFSFHPPLALIDERCHHTGGIFADKRLGLWELKNLPTKADLTCQ